MELFTHEVELKAVTPDIDKVIEEACRTCYQSHNLIKDGSAERLFNQIVKQSHHTSVTEHGSISVYITTDRATMAQITRHRVGMSYSIESQRYCNYSKGKFGEQVSFVVPYELEDNDEAFHVWQCAMVQAELHYFQMLKSGVAPEIARSVLPNSTLTHMYMTGNVASWRHFFKLRASGHAQKDVKYVSALILQAMLDGGVPAYFFDDIEFDY